MSHKSILLIREEVNNLLGSSRTGLTDKEWVVSQFTGLIQYDIARVNDFRHNILLCFIPVQFDDADILQVHISFGLLYLLGKFELLRMDIQSPFQTFGHNFRLWAIILRQNLGTRVARSRVCGDSFRSNK